MLCSKKYFFKEDNMEMTTEQKWVVNAPEGAKITQAKISDDGKSVEIIIVSEVAEEQKTATTNVENFDEMFPIIDPSELIGHEILKHKPKTRRQERLLADILKGIELKLPAFRAPCMDPSEENGRIVFKRGNKPAVGHSPHWWKKTWREFMPSKNSRSGTELHWAAFLGKQLKYLVDEKNYSVEYAWKAVCDDSRDLGHYWNSKDPKYGLEPTGSRKVGAFFDLANTCKILKKWKASGFLLAGGYCCDVSNNCPLANLDPFNNPINNYNFGVGWLVLDV